MEINPGSLETLNRYIQVTVALTALTFYVVVTLQMHTSFHEKDARLPRRAAWPILLPWSGVQRMWKGAKRMRRERMTRAILMERKKGFHDPEEKPESV